MARYELVCTYCGQGYTAKKRPSSDDQPRFCRNSHRAMWHQGIPYNEEKDNLRKSLTQVEPELTQNSSPQTDNILIAIYDQLVLLNEKMAQGVVVETQTTVTTRQGFSQPQAPRNGSSDADIAASLEVQEARKDLGRWGNYVVLYNMQLAQFSGEPAKWNYFSDFCLTIEYGLETNKFPPATRRIAEQALEAGSYDKMMKILKGEEKPPVKAKKLAGAERELAPPDDFDDLDLNLLGG